MANSARAECTEQCAVLCTCFLKSLRRIRCLGSVHALSEAWPEHIANWTQGFYKYKHPPFANSVRIARGELGEVSDQLDAGHDLGYLDVTGYEELCDLCAQALKTNSGLLNHLEGNSKRDGNSSKDDNSKKHF